MIPRQRNEPKPERERRNRRFDATATRRYRSLKAGAWPEVEETAAVVAALTADTVLQILRGHGHYYGLGAEQEHDDENEINPRRYGPRPRPRPLYTTDQELIAYVKAAADADGNVSFVDTRTMTERQLLEQMFGRP